MEKTMPPSMKAAIVLSGIFCLGVGTVRTATALEMDRLTVGGEIRERYEFRDDSDFNHATDDTLSFVGSRIRLHVGYEPAADLGFFFQIQDSRLLGSETSTASNEKNLDLHQGYLTVKNLAGPLTMTLGRQEMMFGDSRLVGNFGWSNIGRSFDGLRLNYSPGVFRMDGWATVTRQYDNAATADPDFTRPSRDSQQFYGIYTSVKAKTLTMEPYAMYLRDTGNEDELDSTGALISPITAPAARGQDRVTAGLRVDGKAASESVDFTGEGAYQTGTMDARGTTPKSDLSAYAFAVKAGYTLPVTFKPRIGIEYDRASGDDDPTDDQFKTFENLFPTNHIHYGTMDYVGWRNMQDLRFSLGIKPTKTTGLSLDYHMFHLVEETDNWYAASGKIFKTTPSGNTETGLGQELDLAAYAMIKEKLRLEAGYGRFFPGDYVEANFPDATDDADFFYLQTGVSF
jgi:hypothetical protein